MNIKSIHITLLALCLCLPALAEEKAKPAPGVSKLAAAEKAYKAGKYQEAIKLFEAKLAAENKKLNPDQKTICVIHMGLGTSYFGAGILNKALDHHQKALATYQQIRAPVILALLAQIYHNIGNVHNAKSEYDKALEFFQKALPIRIKLGLGHPSVSTSHNRIGLVQYAQGKYEEALVSFHKALPILLDTKGQRHDDVGGIYNNIGLVHHGMGEYDKALEFFQKALSIFKITRRPNAPKVGTIYNNIGFAHNSKGEHDKALKCFHNALDIQIEKHGSKDLRVAKSYVGIGLVLGKNSEYDKALENYHKALNIRLEKLDPDHHLVGMSYGNIGHVHHLKGEHGKALKLQQKALDICLEQLGPDHHTVAIIYHHIGLAQLDLNNPTETLASARKARAIEEKRLAYMLSFTSERERLTYQRTQHPYNLLGTLGSAPDLAAAVLHNKGVVLASLLEDQLVAQASRDPAIRDLNRQLTYFKHVLNKLQLELPNISDPKAREQHQAQLKAARAKVEELQQKMARNVAGLGKARRSLSITVRDVQQTLAKDTVLLEFIRYRHYLGKNNGQYRYGAVVLSRDRAPVWVSLGPAKEIESLVRIYHKHLDHKNKSATDIGFEPVLRELHRRLMQPIVKQLPVGTNGLIFSPAGQLNFVSFATLLTNRDHFLCEDYVIEYVSSGRDLIPGGRDGRPSGKVAVFANPDGSLTGTEKEAAFLNSRAKDWKLQPEIYLRERATEVRLTSMASPDILHVTTHGFFWPKSVGRANPMHRSGIILAKPKTGAKPPSENDGTLTAAEASLMKLKGTRIVMLSACQTGQGEVVDGEGVMGLRRAFIQAGTQNLVITLWVIYSGPSVTFMKQFYDRAMADGSASKALWSAQRDLMVQSRKSGKIQKNDKATLTAVKYFGAFVLSH